MSYTQTITAACILMGLSKSETQNAISFAPKSGHARYKAMRIYRNIVGSFHDQTR